jgi:hypothetical protein
MASLELGQVLERDDFMEEYSRGNESLAWWRRMHWGRGIELFSSRSRTRTAISRCSH